MHIVGQEISGCIYFHYLALLAHHDSLRRMYFKNMMLQMDKFLVVYFFFMIM